MAKKMKTVLVLGGYGFLATNIMKYIDVNCKNDYQCIVFDKYPNHQDNIQFDCVTKNYVGDFCDKELMTRIFRENTVDMVLHALSTTIPVSTTSARFDVDTNLLPTIDVLGLMVEYGVKQIVYLSSGGAIYGTKNATCHKESDDVFPVSSYGVVKLAVEKYMMQYAELYGIKPLIVRLSNPYGPYHYSMKQGVINVAVSKALQHQSMQIWGDGRGKKDYIYVEDFVDILFRLISCGVESQVVNIGSGQLLSVNQIVSHVKFYVPDFEWQHVEARQNDATHFELDTSKLVALIGEYPFTPIEIGLEKTVEWTKHLL